MDWTAILLSLRLAACTCAAVLPLALAISAWLAFGSANQSRWARMLRLGVEAVVALPLVLPPTVMGFYLLVLFSPTASPVGRWLQSTLSVTIPFSFWGLLLGSMIYSLPFAVQPMTAAMRAVPRELLDAAKSLGAGRMRTFICVALPLTLPGVVVGMILTFAHTLGEFGIVLMLGGARPGITRTASISIYEDVQAMDYGHALVTSIVLLVIAMSAIVATLALRGRLGWQR